MASNDLHVDRNLAGISVASSQASGKAPKLNAKPKPGKPSDHQHAVVGGGQYSHTHPILDGIASHSHPPIQGNDSDDPDNDHGGHLLGLMQAPGVTAVKAGERQFQFSSGTAAWDTRRDALDHGSKIASGTKAGVIAHLLDKHGWGQAHEALGKNPESMSKDQLVAAHDVGHYGTSDKPGISTGPGPTSPGWRQSISDLLRADPTSLGGSQYDAERPGALAAAEPGQPTRPGDALAMADAPSVKHTHIEAGGGTASHSHPASTTVAHSHKASGDPQNTTGNALLPTKVQAAEGDSPPGVFDWGHHEAPPANPVPMDTSDVTPAHSAQHDLIAATAAADPISGDATMATHLKSPQAEGGHGHVVPPAASSSLADAHNEAHGVKPASGLDLAEGAVMPQLIALNLGERATFDEHELPYLVPGDWTFNGTDIGKLHIGREEMESVVTHFRENARGQDLPVCDIDHIDPAFRGAAVGWVTDLVMREENGQPRVNAVVNLNAVGEKLRAEDAFRYVSPTLLRNWEDPASLKVYPMIAAGVDVRTRGMAFDESGKPVQTDTSAMALTNKPRLKQLGRIAASEDGTEAIVVAIGTKVPSTEANPAKVARTMALADPATPDNSDIDGDGDDDGPVPACQNAPNQGGSCIAFTRWPGDMDGDGACLLSTRGCNAYIGATVTGNLTPLPMIPTDDFSERAQRGQGMPDDKPPVEAAEGGTTTPTATDAPPVAAPSEPAPDHEVAAVTALAEKRTTDQRIEAAEARAAAAEARANEASTRLDAMAMAEKVARVADRLGSLLRSGRILPVEHAKLSESANMVKLAEDDSTAFVLDTLEARPEFSAAGRGAFKEIGTAEAPTNSGVDTFKLTERTKEIVRLAEESGHPVKYEIAARQAAREIAR